MSLPDALQFKCQWSLLKWEFQFRLGTIPSSYVTRPDGLVCHHVCQNVSPCSKSDKMAESLPTFRAWHDS
jgi:hypothetical protein